MDGARRRAGLLWVVAGLGFEITLVHGRQVRPGTATVLLCSVMLLLAATVAAGAPGPLVRRASRAAAVALALDFAGAVADRFGAFGHPGRPGVSWGSFVAFVDYTQVLLFDGPRPLAQAAAVAATAIEVALCVLLIFDYQRRWVGKATAGLLVVYLVSMAASIGLTPVATYAVPVLVGGALLVFACPAQMGRPRSGADATCRALARHQPVAAPARPRERQQPTLRPRRRRAGTTPPAATAQHAHSHDRQQVPHPPTVALTPTPTSRLRDR